MDIVRDQEKKGLLLGKTSPQHPHPVIIFPRAALGGVAQERVVTQSQEIKTQKLGEGGAVEQTNLYIIFRQFFSRQFFTSYTIIFVPKN